MKYKIPEEIGKIDAKFLEFAHENNPEILKIILDSRRLKTDISSANIIKISGILDAFLSREFGMENFTLQHKEKSHKEGEMLKYKRNFVQRFVLKKYNNTWFNSLANTDIMAIKSAFNYNSDEEILHKISSFSTEEYSGITEENFIKFCQYIAVKIHSRNHYSSSILQDQSRENFSESITFYQGKSNRKDFENPPNILEKNAFYNANYCINCHERNKDSCAHGMPNSLEKNLAGCPLEEHISEAIFAFKTGEIIGALAIMMIKNPLVCLTGDRICNDCMKSCIYQAQEAVNIPQIESYIFEQIIDQDWGFELYFLLTRWNPLKAVNFMQFAQNNRAIYISGMGPAGISAAYYGAFMGYSVYFADGRTITEPEIDCTLPIQKFALESVNSHVNLSCFGGIMEYGITARWNKNRLFIAYLVLKRFTNIKFISDMKYTQDLEEILLKKLQIDAILIANGTKNPRNSAHENESKFYINGSDFLMYLHAQKTQKSPMESCNIALPAVVLGGGLTAIDVATEIGFYYLKKLDIISEKLAQNNSHFSEMELKNLPIYIADLAKIQGKNLTDVQKIKILGGVQVIMRSEIQQCEAYKTNHVEILEASKLGVQFIDKANIVKTHIQPGNIVNLHLSNGSEISAKTVIICHGSEHEKYTENYQKNPIYIGDLSKNYSGSVVKAIGSGEKAIANLAFMPKNTREKPDICAYFATNITIENMSENISKVNFSSEFLSSQAQIGDLIRLKIWNKLHESEAIPLIIAGRENNSFYCLVKQVGISTKMIGGAGVKYSVMLSSKSPELQEIMGKKCDIYYDESRAHVALELAKNLPNCTAIDIQKCTNFNLDNAIFFCSSQSMQDVSNMLKLSINHGKYGTIRWIISTQMQCMLSGVCSKCRYITCKTVKYGCHEYLINPMEVDFAQFSGKNIA